MTDLGSSISNDQQRVSSLEKDAIGIKSILDHLSQTDLRLSQLEKRLQNVSLTDDWLNASRLIQRLSESNEHLIHQFVNVVNRQAELENKLNVTFLLLDHLMKSKTSTTTTTSTEDPYRPLQ